MKICALSDIHGNLPSTKLLHPVDVMVICGDTVMLQIQRSGKHSEEWFGITFANWAKTVPADKIIIIAGNHDFWMEYKDKQYIKDKFDKWTDSKVVYLEDDLYEYQDVTFYGCPWCDGPVNWAFCPNAEVSVIPKYEQIPHCDVLLTHQPPRIDNIGVSFWGTSIARDFGSDALRENIKDKDILVNFSGHIHSGDHELVTLEGCDTVFYNVALLNEGYSVGYLPRYVEINKEQKMVSEINF